ncbi:hypothetical protein C8N46_11360 [Kordia periserrulae]|uniref:Uncharacterized protein n=1 Tax=Kordia periserrulae TaxID=701523 RepID=A0A2T6BR87_9FLAO|nr:hypothetical protein C8N46_11360 [Kordia periserrulae]
MDLRILKAEMIVHIYTAVGVGVAILSFIKFFS